MIVRGVEIGAIEKAEQVRPFVVQVLGEPAIELGPGGSKRKHGSRIPEALWRAAAKLARQDRPGKIAHALGRDYYCLMKRLDSAKKNSASAPEAKAVFVELLPSVTVPDCECTFDLEHPHGAKMKIHLKGASTADLSALGRALWSAEA